MIKFAIRSSKQILGTNFVKTLNDIKKYTYIDTTMEGEITDYMGNTSQYHELSGVHLQPADYSLSVTQEYFNYFMSVQDLD